MSQDQTAPSDIHVRGETSLYSGRYKRTASVCDDGCDVTAVPVKSDRHLLESPLQSDNRSHRESSANDVVSKRRGLCLIIVNYTDELDGFEVDVSAIEALYKSLDYDVIGGKTDNQWRNLSVTEMRHQLQTLVRDINSSAPNADYDCAVIFVLTSHGQVFYRSSDASCVDGDDDNRITPAQIVNILGEANDLQKKPKLLVLANLRSAETLAEQPPYWQFSMQESTQNAVIFQSYSLAHQSIVVPHQGSGLIQLVTSVFRQHHAHMHVRDLLCEVNLRIRHMFCEQFDGDNRSPTLYLPSWASTLWKQFFLTSERSSNA